MLLQKQIIFCLYFFLQIKDISSTEFYIFYDGLYHSVTKAMVLKQKGLQY